MTAGRSDVDHFAGLANSAVGSFLGVSQYEPAPCHPAGLLFSLFSFGSSFGVASYSTVRIYFLARNTLSSRCFWWVVITYSVTESTIEKLGLWGYKTSIYSKVRKQITQLAEEMLHFSKIIIQYGLLHHAIAKHKVRSLVFPTQFTEHPFLSSSLQRLQILEAVTSVAGVTWCSGNNHLQAHMIRTNCFFTYDAARPGAPTLRKRGLSEWGQAESWGHTTNRTRRYCSYQSFEISLSSSKLIFLFFFFPFLIRKSEMWTWAWIAHKHILSGSEDILGYGKHFKTSVFRNRPQPHKYCLELVCSMSVSRARAVGFQEALGLDLAKILSLS